MTDKFEFNIAAYNIATDPLSTNAKSLTDTFQKYHAKNLSWSIYGPFKIFLTISRKFIKRIRQ